MDLATLEREALNLDIKSRGHLASVLLRSLDETDETEDLSEEEIEKLWLVEVERRSREMDEDPSLAVPYEDMMKRLRERFG